MQWCKQQIEDKASEARCTSRVKEMRAIISKYRRTLHPHDFCPSMEDVGQIPDIRKATIEGTDEEFDACVKDISSELPKLTSRILEERTARVSAQLPFNERPDNALSLAKVWFSYGPGPFHSCLVDGTEALSHRNSFPRGYPPGRSIGEETFNLQTLGQRWWTKDSTLSFSEAASAVARRLILDCSEDPESITLAEMNSKFHRFVFYESDKLVAHNWRETVRLCGYLSSRANYPHAHQLDHKYRNPFAQHWFLGPVEYPEFVYDPDAYDEVGSWNCLPCWRSEDSLHLAGGLMTTLPALRQHIRAE